MEQDGNLELQRSRERLGQIADLAVAQLAASLDDWNLSLHELNSLPPSHALQARLPVGATFILLSPDSINVYPTRPLLFTPVAPLVQAQSFRAFDVADELELRDQQYDSAIAKLQILTRESATRPEALLRIARIEHKMNRKEAALDTYGLLTGGTALNPSGTPYEIGRAHV